MKDQTFKHKSSLGQNFLTDRNILGQIVKWAAIDESDILLEIGAGQGVLTRELALSPCSRIFALEIDKTLHTHLDPLEEEFRPRLSIIWDDAVTFDYETKLPAAPTKVVANIPYNITTPLIWRLLEAFAGKGLHSMILMVQREAALRLNASPNTKDRYPLGITLEIMGERKILRRFPSLGQARLLRKKWNRNFCFIIKEEAPKRGLSLFQCYLTYARVQATVFL
jgi:16S rRNA (adenine1518-N6/adenine1519-N6)-dimethyltransferase